MKITSKLVERLKGLGLDAKHADIATRDEGVVRSFLIEKMMSNAITNSEVAALVSEDEENAAASLIAKAINPALAAQQSQIDTLVKGMGSMTEAITKLVSGGLNIPTQTKATDIGAAAALLNAGVGAIGGDGGSLGAGDSDPSKVRVKCVSELYSKSCQPLDYSMSSNDFVRKNFKGQVMSPSGEASRALNTASELDKAVTGAWFKHAVNQACHRDRVAVPRAFKMTELDNRICQYAVHNCKFVGPIGDEDDRQTVWMTGGVLENEVQRKALLDDSTSGGLTAVPIEFDNAIVTQAILTGELFPFITVISTSRRRIEGSSIGNITFSNTAEGTAVTPFNTTSFAAAFNTTIFPIVGMMELGLDFLDDAPVNMAAMVSDRYAQGFANRLDQLVGEGSGTGEMLGLMNTSGLTSITSANGTGGPPTVSDYEGLLFGVGKAYRQEAGKTRSVFLSNDTTYRRMRSIQVGASDQRRVYGMEHENYMTHDHPHKICESTVNTRAGFFCLNRYRAYRRLGYTVKIEQGGKQLVSSNQQLIYVRARYGGQLELGAAGARCTTMQS